MVDKKIFEIADQLKSVVKEQQVQAHKALLSLPEGETKNSLKRLLNEASSGRLSQQDAQKELEKIMKDAR